LSHDGPRGEARGRNAPDDAAPEAAQRDPALRFGAGRGVQIMRYREELNGGTLSVESDSGVGTIVRCALSIDG